MSNRAKNILIGFLILVIACLLWMLYVQSYGRYCKPIIKDEKYYENADSLRKENSKIPETK